MFAERIELAAALPPANEGGNSCQQDGNFPSILLSLDLFQSSPAANVMCFSEKRPQIRYLDIPRFVGISLALALHNPRACLAI